MTTHSAAVAAAQASPVHSAVWPVVLVMTVTLVAVLAWLRRLRPVERGPVQLMATMVTLFVAAFGVVFPVLMPARQYLDELAKAGGENILAFVILTATFGTASLVFLTARILWAIGNLVFRAATRARRLSPAAEVPAGGAAATLAALGPASDPGRDTRP